jgi:DNA-binding CsgD family transcriptional regulator/N-acetylneuraminic acid mutarotase
MPELNEKLSERELEILRLVATGAANKEIAHQLVISPNTVKVHVRNIFDKIGVSSRTEATLYAVQIGLVRPTAAIETTADTVASAEPEASAEELNAIPSVSGVEDQSETSLVTKSFKTLPWLVGLVIFIAVLVLIGSGILRARLPTTTATPAPTVAAIATAQVTHASRWEEKTALPSPRKGMGIVEYENAIYVLAGETRQGMDGAVLRYDEAKNGWTVLANKPTPVTDIQAALIGEKIYIPGGRQADGTATNQFEVFDPRKSAWEKKADLPIPLSAYSLATVEGQLYLFGGKNGDQYSARVYIYNPPEDRWTERTPLSSPRAYAGAIESEGKIYIMGGYDGQHALKLNEVYIPTRDVEESSETPWKTLAPLPEGRYAMGIAQLAGIVFLMGGLDERGQTPAISAVQYTLRKDQWTVYEKPPIQVGGYLALLSSGNFLYILGGETSQGLSAANLTYRAIYTTTVPILLNEKAP